MRGEKRSHGTLNSPADSKASDHTHVRTILTHTSTYTYAFLILYKMHSETSKLIHVLNKG